MSLVKVPRSTNSWERRRRLSWRKRERLKRGVCHIWVLQLKEHILILHILHILHGMMGCVISPIVGGMRWLKTSPCIKAVNGDEIRHNKQWLYHFICCISIGKCSSAYSYSETWEIMQWHSSSLSHHDRSRSFPWNRQPRIYVAQASTVIETYGG